MSHSTVTKPKVRAFARVIRANGDVEIVEIDDVEVTVQPPAAEQEEN